MKEFILLFLDGQHDKQTITEEFNFVANNQKKGDLIFFDDVNENSFPELFFFVNDLLKTKIYSIDFIKVSENRTYAVAKKN